MRSQHLLIIVGIGFLAWLVLMSVGPVRLEQVSVYERLGWMVFCGIFMGMWGGQLAYKTTHRFSAPNLNTTLSQPQPLDIIEIPVIESDKPLGELGSMEQLADATAGKADVTIWPTTKMLIFALGGTHVGPIKGGGKDNGYFVAPEDLVNTWEGEYSQVRANVEWRVYVESPDKSHGERDLKELPQPIYERLKRFNGFHKRAPVYFGFYKWQGDDEVRERHRYLEIRNGEQEKEIKELSTRCEILLDALTKGSMAHSAITGAYGSPRDNKTREEKDSMNPFKKDKEQ